MSELVLHWIWKNRLYEPAALRTLCGEVVEVKHPGNPCSQGPDFQGAHIRIEGLLWIGSVEIDLYPSLWQAHGHHRSPAYQGVILHVVWTSPPAASTRDAEGREIPILPLAPAVPEDVIKRLYPKKKSFPCAGLARNLPAEAWLSLYDQWGENRLRARHRLYRSEHELIQAFWSALLYSFGVPNGEPYKQIAELLPWATFCRHAESLIEKEAALLGVAGLLDSVSPPVEDYEKQLVETWAYLRRKMGWTSHRFQWRTWRPPTSPWRRLAQLAALVQGHPTLLGLLVHPPAELPLPNLYWQTHWAWQRPFPKPLRRSTPFLYRSVLINAIYPFAIYYFRSIGRIEQALAVLDKFRQLPPESHTYARLYAEYAYPPQNAWQTQGQIQLWREACEPQACLACSVGRQLLER
ncbi:MAG: DUF2851 family protein [Bacteroidia bacterium]|nr:DUF2851 family protein [Bacteroidia bacterium]